MRAIHTVIDAFAMGLRVRRLDARDKVVVTIDLASLETQVDPAPAPGCDGGNRDLSTVGRTPQRR